MARSLSIDHSNFVVCAFHFASFRCNWECSKVASLSTKEVLQMQEKFIKLALGLALAGAVAWAGAVQPMPLSTKPEADSIARAGQWTTSWIAPPEPTWSQDFVLPLRMPADMRDVTLRQSLRLAVGGERVRLVISNAYGQQPLRVGRVHVAVEGSADAAPVRFQGKQGIMVAAGAQALSDPIDLRATDGTRLQVDIYLPESTRLAGFHWDARDRTLLLPGDAIGKAGATGESLDARAFLSAVMVDSIRKPVTVVALGDSITDGNGATPGADRRWPDFLARRLAPEGVTVLNAGISGNRLLGGGMGESALARLERDVLGQPGVQAVVVLLGTNDIGWPGGPFAPNEAAPTVETLSQGLLQLIEQAHLRGIRVIGATVTPFEDALKGTPLEGHYSASKEVLRKSLNDWIRNSGSFDAVVDFDRVLRDPARPARMQARFDSGDHLHPGDAGYEAMAGAIALETLLGVPK
ncbi:SGNH/GDSL hydrolase family protein [Pandoraea sputorum]|nr:SGNH/GDSL hydrolase family protein [Pandoraea sputorum]